MIVAKTNDADGLRLSPIGPTNDAKIPLWLYFPLSAFSLWAGLAVISIFMTDPAGTEKLAVLRQAPLWALVLIPIGEAVLWTVAFVEAAAYFRAAVAGAILGVLAYSLAFHWSAGIAGIIGSAWLGAVLNVAYVLMRTRSRLAAAANVVALRWGFVAYAYYSAMFAVPGGAA